MILANIILNKTDCLETLLNRLAERGIRGATIIDTTGMANSLSQDLGLRLIDSFRQLMDLDEGGSKTVFMLAEENQMAVISEVCQEVVGPLNQANTAILFAVPLVYVEGLGDRKIDLTNSENAL